MTGVLIEQQRAKADGGAVVDRYPLSPMQQGMLYHHLTAPGSGVDLEQIVCTLPEAVDAGALERAWQRVVDRHPALRTSLRWEGEPAPVQLVHARARVAIEPRDLRSLPTSEARREELDRFLAADRARGFRYDEAPLLRLTLFRLADAEYQLVWSFPHVLVDGNSFPTVLGEVFTLYDAAVRGEPEPALPAPRPFRAYVDWLARRDRSADEAFWRGALTGFGAPTPIVAPRSDADGKAAPDLGTATRELRLPEATTSALRQLGQAHGLTLNTFVQGAWLILLSRYTGEEDVVFGATRAGRRGTVEGAEETVGIFINTLPVRAQPAADRPALAWLAELRERQRAVRPHEHTPLVDVQRWSDLPPGAPLFETLIVFDTASLDSVLRARGGAFARRRFALYERTGFALTLNAYGEASLRLKLTHERGRFDDAAAERLLGHLAALLDGMAAKLPADPALTLGALSHLTPAEREQVLVTWNRAVALDVPTDRRVHHFIEAQVARTPDAVAVTAGGRSLSYRELNERANRLARRLRASGVGPDDRVGICMRRSADLVVSIVATLKAGGAYVPLDPAYPADRIAYMLESSSATVLLTEAALASRLPAFAGPVVAVDAQWDAEIAREGAANLEGGPAPESLAYVLYTSGSTGKPKGVMVEQRNVVNLLAAMDQVLDDGRGPGVWLALTSFNFDISVVELLWTLTRGFQIVLYSEDDWKIAAAAGGGADGWQVQNGETIPELCARHGVTHLQCTPSRCTALLKDEEIRPSFRALRVVVLGGEAFSTALAEDLLSLVPGRVINGYGPTETTVYSVMHRITSYQQAIPIGRPVANTELYVLDAAMQPVHVGGVGELYIGGAGVSRGYMGRPDLTAERFLPHPFSDEPGARVYRTGDLVRYRPNGDMDYLGRMDHQVKVRGFRIELGEIEAVLRAHPGVGDAVVVAREDVPGDKRLVAYTVPRPGAAAPSAAALRERLRAELPSFMVPSHFVALDALPLTPNKKVDRKALPAPRLSAAEAAASSSSPPDGAAGARAAAAKPADDVEARLVAMWERMLGVRGVGVDDNFFELGGHSLLAMTMFGEIPREFGRKLPISALIQTPTIRGLAAQLRRPAGGAAASAPSSGTTPAARGAQETPTLFFVPTAGGELLGYRQLLARLPADQPWHGLQPPQRGDGAPPLDRIEDLAVYYVAELQRQQPHGPYYLVGWCVGGVVAYEMAQQLRIRGERVAMLMLIDANYPRASEPSLADRARAYGRLLARKGPADAARFIAEQVGHRISARLARPVPAAAPPSPGADDPCAVPMPGGTVLEADALSDALAARRYQPRPYDGRLILIWPSERPEMEEAFVNSREAWTKAARGGAEHHVLEGNHHSIMLEPRVQVMAPLVLDCARRAREAEAGTTAGSGGG